MAKHRARNTELDRLFRTARRDVPSPAAQRELHGAVLAALRSGVGPASGSAEPSGDPVHPSQLAAKLLVTAGVVAVLAAGIHQLRPDGRAPSSDAPDRAGSAEPATLPSSAASSPVLSRDAGKRPLEPRSSADPPPQPDSKGSSRANATVAVSKTQPRALPSEASLIDQAHRQLKSAPARALALTETHRRLYREGVLAEEREVVAIEALSRLGSARAARDRAESFRAEQPRSIHEPRLRSALEDAGPESKR